jgi:D-alanyl-D-alanine-carboxypeptidase/D-alanyl-D-alanine-endopeptidase
MRLHSSALAFALVLAGCSPLDAPRDAPLSLDAAQSDASGDASGDAASEPDAGESSLRAHAATFVGSGTIEITPLEMTMRVAQLPTVVVGVIGPSHREVFALSRSDVVPAPTTRSVYSISSISKLFTGLIAARGVARGDFAPTTQVASMLPAEFAVVGDRTLLELVTHTAGYSSNPTNWTGPRSSPAADYTLAQLATCLGNPMCSSVRTMRGRYTYSNLGVGLLGVALADHYDTSFEGLLTSHLTRDLGMLDTHTREFADTSRIQLGYTPAGEEVPPATMGVLALSGELLSTGEDMQRLLDALIHPPTELAPAIALATTPSVAVPTIGYGIDVVSRRGMDLRAKSGEQPGYASMIFWSPTEQIGAFAMTNVGGASPTLVALLLDLLERLR